MVVSYLILKRRWKSFQCVNLLDKFSEHKACDLKILLGQLLGQKIEPGIPILLSLFLSMVYEHVVKGVPDHTRVIWLLVNSRVLVNEADFV